MVAASAAIMLFLLALPVAEQSGQSVLQIAARGAGCILLGTGGVTLISLWGRRPAQADNVRPELLRRAAVWSLGLVLVAAATYVYLGLLS